jgi:polyhydroxyalkanoate synthesis regulator phasin
VERELASLAMEVKLTAGPKKAALEHLRKLIEISSEKIKSARLKEEQAKKVWEAAVKVVEAEESNKQRLCDDLKCLVQQSAEAQYSRLEELTQRLEALNPELRGGAAQLLAAGVQKNSSDSNVPHLHANQQSPHNGEGDNVTVSTSLTASGIPKVAAIVASINSHQSPTALPSSPVPGSTPEPDGQGEGLDKDHSVGHSTPPVSHGQHVPVPRGRGRVAGRIRGSLRLGRSKSGTEGGEWTGAGFDVDDGAP